MAALRTDALRSRGIHARTQHSRLVGKSLDLTLSLLGAEFVCLSITVALQGGLKEGQTDFSLHPRDLIAAEPLILYICSTCYKCHLIDRSRSTIIGHFNKPPTSIEMHYTSLFAVMRVELCSNRLSICYEKLGETRCQMKPFILAPSLGFVFTSAQLALQLP